MAALEDLKDRSVIFGLLRDDESTGEHDTLFQIWWRRKGLVLPGSYYMVTGTLKNQRGACERGQARNRAGGIRYLPERFSRTYMDGLCFRY